LPLAMIPLVLGICLLLLKNLSLAMPATSVHGTDGVWDLRDFDPVMTNIRLSGDVEYIPGMLLAPDEYEAYEGSALASDTPLVEALGTSRIIILVPEEDGYYTFTRPGTGNLQRIFANGELVSEVGNPSTESEIVTPSARTTFTTKAEFGVIELVQQFSGYIQRGEGHEQDWIVGGAELSRTVAVSDFTHNIEMGIYLSMFLVHFMLFFIMNSYRPNLYFALMSLMWLLRAGVTGPQIFSTLFPAMDAYTKLRIEHIATPVVTILTIIIVYQLFPKVMHRMLWKITLVVSALFIVGYLFTDLVFVGYAAPIYQALYVVAIIYILTRLLMKLRKINMEQGMFVLGMLILALAAVHDFLFYNTRFMSAISNVELTQIAVLAFAFFEAMAVFLSTIRAIETARERAQHLATENEALDRMNYLKSELMATISHEARTPLAVLASYAGLVSMELRDRGVDTQTAADLDKITYEAKRIAGLIDSMALIRLYSDLTGERVPVDLLKIVEQTAGLYNHILHRVGVALLVEVPEELPHVLANSEELTQVIFNLLQNAKNHTSSGNVTIRLASNEDKVSLTIADTGRGIPPELIPQIFERGVRGEDGGSGLGLAICHDIITSHDGTIEIESTLHIGTAVTFSLPIYKKEESPDEDKG